MMLVNICHTKQHKTNCAIRGGAVRPSPDHGFFLASRVRILAGLDRLGWLPVRSSRLSPCAHRTRPRSSHPRGWPEGLVFKVRQSGAPGKQCPDPDPAKKDPRKMLRGSVTHNLTGFSRSKSLDRNFSRFKRSSPENGKMSASPSSVKPWRTKRTVPTMGEGAP